MRNYRQLNPQLDINMWDYMATTEFYQFSDGYIYFILLYAMAYVNKQCSYLLYVVFFHFGHKIFEAKI